MTHYQNLIQQFNSVARNYGTWEVFSDWIALCAISYSNAVDRVHFEEREAEYMRIVKKYDTKTINEFPSMMASLILAMEEEPRDILGKLYCELGISDKWKGQFFTPDTVCRMMGKMVLFDIEEKIKEKGFITVQEPAIGGGALIINLALSMQEQGINYQQSMLVTGVDVDIKSIYMSYIQLTLMHIPAILIHGNSLSMEVYSKWVTPAYVMGGWAFKKQKEKKNIIQLPVAAVSGGKMEKPYESISLFG